MKATPIDTTELCKYGCGRIAKYINKSKNLMCDEHNSKCPANRQKNSIGLKNSDRDYVATYQNLPQEIKNKMAWSSGLTKETDLRVSRPNMVGRKFGSSITGHSEETRQKLSQIKSNWLKNSDNRTNLGRHKRSWMESTFETYLTENNITGWTTEVHFWNDDLKKNYFPDFIFEDKKLIIELDGTQHRKTKDLDNIRDMWFSNLGYKVVRIPHAEFKERFFSGKGFLDLLGS